MVANSKSRRAKRRDEEALAAAGGIPKEDRKIGVLRLTPNQQKLIDKKNEMSQETLQNSFVVMMDVENIKMYDLPDGFDVQTMRKRFKKFLQARYPKAVLTKLNGVGSLAGFFGEGANRFTPWAGVSVCDIFPRTSNCAKCGDPIQTANPLLRATVYENVTDIADDQLEQLMYDHVRGFGRPCRIFLVSGDSDFVRPVEILKSLGVDVYLAKPKNCSRELEAAVPRENVVDFSEILNTPT